MKRKIYLLFISALFCIYAAKGQADLQLKDISFSSNQVTEGESMTTTFKVINTGSEDAVASNVTVYLSSDATLNTGIDTQLENWSLSSLESGSISTYTDYTISIPEGYGGSTYYLFLFADEELLVSETNENNNSSSQQILIKEKNDVSNDLTIRNPSLSKATAYRSETISFDAEIRNLGTDPVNGASFKVIISESNSSIGGSSEILYSETGNLAGNGSYAFTSEPIQIPSDWATGSAYIHFVADQNNTVQETNESNNSFYTSIQIKETPKPELSIQSFNLSANIVVHDENLSTTVKIINSSETDAGDFYISYYLDTDNDLSNGNSSYLDDYYVSSLDAQESRDINQNLQIPSGAPLGIYYIHAIIDSGSDVSESNEDNNQATSINPIRIDPKDIDLVVENETINGTTFKVGQSVTFEARVRNTGSQSINYSYLGYYISEDASWDSSDDYISQDYVSSLSANSYSDESYNFTFNDSYLGNYYILFVADRHNYRIENDENNNVKAVPVTIQPAFFDFQITSADDFASEWALNATNQIDLEIVNNGIDGLDGLLNITFYASLDNVFGNDAFIGQYSHYGIDGGETINLNDINVYTYANMEVGTEYTLFAKIDNYNNYDETDETNNTFLIGTISAREAEIDFTISNASLSQINQIELDATNYIYYDYKNTGSDHAEYTYTGFYLSEDPTLDINQDTRISIEYEPAIAGNASVSASKYIYLSRNNYSTGTYYLFLVADYNERRDETNEANNVYSFGQVELYEPDFDVEITAASTTSTDWLKGSINDVTYDVINNGINDDVAYTYTGFYLSTDNALDDGDVLIDTDYTSALDPQESITQNHNISVPDNISDGTYYVLFEADTYGYRSEANEDNNVFSMGQVTISAPDFDLEITTASISSTELVNSGNSVQVNYMVVNNGSVNEIGSSNTGFYLSTDNILNTSEDDYVGSDGVGALAPGASTNESRNISVSGVTPGTYYLFLMADRNQNFSETNETNNTFSIEVTVRDPDFDLEITSASTTSTDWLKGSTNDLSYEVVNNGIEDVIAFTYTQFYLSVDNILDGEDLSLGIDYTSALNPQETITQNHNVNISSEVADGSYYLFLVADAYDYRAEVNEDNNVFNMGQITLSTPDFDLEITSASLSSTELVNSGNSIQVDYTLTNNGVTDDIGSTSTGFYLSTDNTLDTGVDDYLTSQSVGSISAGGSTNETRNISVSGITPGTYYLFIYADRYENYSETNENNNTYSIEVTVRNADYDIEITAASTTSTDWLKGSTNDVSYDVTNNGTLDQIPYTYTRFYLSNDNILDDTDLSLGTDYVPSLNPAETSNLNHNVSVPSEVADGTYYILLEADTYDYRSEINENNNIFSMGQVTITAPDFDLEISNIVLSSTTWKRGGVSQSITYDVTNNATLNDIPGYSYTGFYLSTDMTWDSNDIRVDTDYNSALAAGATSNESASIEIAADEISTGTYYVILQADTYEYFDEVNETNNYITTDQITLVDADFDLEMTASNIANTAWEKGVAESIEYTLSNNGTVDDISYSYTRIFISTDQVIDNNDYILTSDYSSTVAAGSTLNVTHNFTVPSDIDDGTYYVLFEVDIYEYWDETDESNNQYVGTQVTISTGAGGRTTTSSASLLSKKLMTYPNPATDFIRIKNQEELKGQPFSMFDQTGKEVLKGKLDEHSIDVRALPAGMYLIHLNVEGKNTMLRLIKN